MNKLIEVVVSPAGKTQVTTKGFVGGECLQASKFLEDALGVRAAEHKTGEFFAVMTMEQQARQ